MDSPFRARRLTPAEVRRILRRAVDLAEQDPETQAAERTLSQEELERLGGELGLPSTAIRGALAHRASPAEAEASPWRPPRRLLLEEEFDGELPAERHEDVADAIQSHMADAGRTQVIGKTLTWAPTPTTQGQVRQLTVAVRSRDGKTRVRVEENLQQFYMAIQLGLGLGLGLGVGFGAIIPIFAMAGWALLGVGLGVTFAIFVLLMARLIYASIVKRRTRQLEALRARLDEVVRQGIVAGAQQPARARIAVSAAAESDAESDAEAEAEAEAEAGAKKRSR